MTMLSCDAYDVIVVRNRNEIMARFYDMTSGSGRGLRISTSYRRSLIFLCFPSTSRNIKKTFA